MYDYSHQDWKPVIIKKKPKSKKEALKKGYGVTTKKKNVSNKIKKNNISNDMDEQPKLKKINVNLRNIMQKARTDLNLKQKDFAQRLNLPISIVKNYESGKAIPSSHILNKMSKVLKVKLQGPNIGAPISPKGKKKKK